MDKVNILVCDDDKEIVDAIEIYLQQEGYHVIKAYDGEQAIEPILPDIGMFASFDPVALDQACADACLKATPIANSQLGEHLAEPGWHCHHDHFKDSNPNIEWKATLDQAEKIGLGTREYELKIIK